MIASGLLKEGFTIVKEAADRYDGELRTGMTDRAWGYSGNPFGDDECGKFYARAMSNWSVLLACQGFVYDGPAGLIGFKPAWRPHDHVSFFTSATGWGVFSQRRKGKTQTEGIEVRHGAVRVKSLIFQTPAKTDSVSVTVSYNKQKIPATHKIDRGEVTVILGRVIEVRAGQTLIVELR
jgi:hypothetical protein